MNVFKVLELINEKAPQNASILSQFRTWCDEHEKYMDDSSSVAEYVSQFPEDKAKEIKAHIHDVINMRS